MLINYFYLKDSETPTTYLRAAAAPVESRVLSARFLHAAWNPPSSCWIPIRPPRQPEETPPPTPPALPFAADLTSYHERFRAPQSYQNCALMWLFTNIHSQAAEVLAQRAEISQSHTKVSWESGTSRPRRKADTIPYPRRRCARAIKSPPGTYRAMSNACRGFIIAPKSTAMADVIAGTHVLPAIHCVDGLPAIVNRGAVGPAPAIVWSVRVFRGQ